ncbi:MAG TPA: ankyrin repeat domain-containing protein [bacterium]|nr:ankyrin repeat domain-containing protein [bacterium]
MAEEKEKKVPGPEEDRAPAEPAETTGTTDPSDQPEGEGTGSDTPVPTEEGIPTSPEEAGSPSGTQALPTTDPSAPPQDIFEAIRRQDKEAVVEFLNKKVNLSLINEEDKTPLLCAAEIGALEIVRLLIDHGAALEAKAKDRRTPLMLAISNAHPAVAAYLLQKGADVNVHSITHYTPIMQAAAKGYLDLMREMIPKADKINTQNDEGRTALMIAARFGHRDIIDLLLARNASLQIADKNGNGAISFAETAELKAYLTEKLEEEKRRGETEKEEKKRKKREAHRKVPRPQLLLLALLAFLVMGFGSFSYFYYKTKIKNAIVEIPPFVREAAGIVSHGYCKKTVECRNRKESFMTLCKEQVREFFAAQLVEQGTDLCDNTKAAQCSDCLATLPCNKATQLSPELLKKECLLCLKVCARKD